MAVCDITIKKDIAPSCDDPIVPGLEQEGVIMNRAEVDFGAVTFNATRKNVIETLALKTGKKGYKVQVFGATPFTGTNTALATGTYRNTFTNTVNMVVLANDPDVCNDIIDGLANGEFVIVLENKAKGLNKTENPGDSAFQVYGYYQGKPQRLAMTSTLKKRKGDGVSLCKKRRFPNQHYSCTRHLMMLQKHLLKH